MVKFEQAQKAVEMALEVLPDFEPARDLLDRLSAAEQMDKGWSQFWERQRQRELARRERQRLKLTTPDPTVAEGMGIYTKEILTSIARRIIPWGGWSAFKKAQLRQLLVDYLLEEESLPRVLALLAPGQLSVGGVR